jgi:hypothetical protein
MDVARSFVLREYKLAGVPVVRPAVAIRQTVLRQAGYDQLPSHTGSLKLHVDIRVREVHIVLVGLQLWPENKVDSEYMAGFCEIGAYPEILVYRFLHAGFAGFLVSSARLPGGTWATPTLPTRFMM